MKRLGLAVAAVVMSASVSFAQSNEVKMSKEPFMVNTEKLSSYLQLTSTQYNEVADINAYFIEKQNESIKSSSKLQSKKMYQAVYGNLKLMKRVLTPEQYRKYVVLLNITNNNNRMMGIQAMPDTYLADNK
ncbi:MAG: hypothetical protein PHX50_10385 [Massilibacteroides sp.]|nr:hypothetical protein [Massilibacteroides sp.]MDD3063219.1 hypothetical protein [Massilibacteroides sp.]MDD4659564.1 hypothetical protein [Massilibacteroides sp.]